jgi:hypothetical protein
VSRPVVHKAAGRKGYRNLCGRGKTSSTVRTRDDEKVTCELCMRELAKAAAG